MLDKTKITKVLSSVAAAALIISPSQAMAWGGDSNWHRNDRHDRDRDSYRHNRPFQHKYRHYPRHGSIVFDLPFGVIKLVIGGNRYYYCDGVYYSRANFNYVVVPPPIGATVTVLPMGMQRININGVDYYTSDGIFYQYTPRGYVVVPQPTTTIIQTVRNVETVSVVNNDRDVSDVFTVNISNSKGGYTAVNLKKKDNGYIGPQGEFYPEFPKVEQLKAMYGK